ncbi:MAG: penicillin-binding transpeptidase domain-containing protein [Bacteroidota bacterium]
MATLIKNEVLVRVYSVLAVLVIAGLLVFMSAVRINIKEGDKWRAQGEQYLQLKKVEAERGNILTENEELLATSLPVFDIAFDPSVVPAEEFNTKIDSLSARLAGHIDLTLTSGGLRDYFIQKREDNQADESKLRNYLAEQRRKGKRFILLKRGVSLAEKEQLSKYPIFDKGQFGGGFIAKPRYRRDRPYGILARRTIGYVRKNANPVGIEGYYDKRLRGMSEEQWMRLVDPVEELWIPAVGFEAAEPRKGDDIVTTIDLDLQEITETALSRAMNYHDAEWGTAVVMEVQTGKIRSIANLGRTSDGWWETFNYAVGQPIEPGSVFKLASMMALLEDNYISLEDSIALYKGRIKYYDDEMVDSYNHNMDSTTIRRAFEISSNVGISSLVDQHYRQTRKEAEFIQHLKDFRLNLPAAVEIDGEIKPFIKEAGSVEDQWSGTTLPWMSIGYELTLTPLQLLTFYNAVANNGMLMKPYLVTEIQHLGETLETFKPRIIDQSIASRKTINAVQGLLEGVVEQGTAKKLKTDKYHFSGKTGTAQINYQRLKNKTFVGGYQASFAGFFPSENPLYSCIVVINRPRNGKIYGADVAGPVFREIADKAFASKIELHAPVNEGKSTLAARQLPNMNIGESSDMQYLLSYFDIPHYGKAGSEWAVLKATPGDSIKVLTRRLKKGKVPNVVGLGLRDALYALENKGLKTKVVGAGKVYQQSILAGTRVNGQTVTIRLR